MISLSSAPRILIVTVATDMRKSFNGLYGIVAHRLHENPLAREPAGRVAELLPRQWKAAQDAEARDAKAEVA